MKPFKITIAVIILVLVLVIFHHRNRDLTPSGGNLAYAFIMPHPPIIVPEVGGANTYRASKTFSAVNYVAKQVVKANPDTIILITPHSVYNPEKFSIFTGDKVEGNLEKFGAPGVKYTIETDTDFIKGLNDNLAGAGLELNSVPSETRLDHGSFVPIYFLKKAGYSGRFVIMNYSGVSRQRHVQFGQIIRKTIKNSGKKLVFIASGDLSHRKEGRDFDRKIVEYIKTGNYESIMRLDAAFVKEAWQCGYNSMLIGLGVVGIKPMQNRVFSYEAPFGVGYMVSSL